MVSVFPLFASPYESAVIPHSLPDSLPGFPSQSRKFLFLDCDLAHDEFVPSFVFANSIIPYARIILDLWKER